MIYIVVSSSILYPIRMSRCRYMSQGNHNLGEIAIGLSSTKAHDHKLVYLLQYVSEVRTDRALDKMIENWQRLIRLIPTA